MQSDHILLQLELGIRHILPYTFAFVHLSRYEQKAIRKAPQLDINSKFIWDSVARQFFTFHNLKYLSCLGFTMLDII